MNVTRPRVDGIIATAVCTAGEVAGDIVYISGDKDGSNYTVRKVDITDFTKMPAVAIVVYKTSATFAVIQFQGETNVYTGLIPGRVYWVSDTGVPTPTPPTVTTGQRKYWQSIGVAVDSARIKLEFEKNLKVRVG